MEIFQDKHKTLKEVPISLLPLLQAFTTEGSSVVEEKETNLKFGDELLTINMGALLAEVRNDSVNFPSIRDELQEKAEKEVEEIQEMVEQEMVEQEMVEEVEDTVTSEAPESGQEDQLYEVLPASSD